jgi:hypothetical protein
MFPAAAAKPPEIALFSAEIPSGFPDNTLFTNDLHGSVTFINARRLSHDRSHTGRPASGR